MTIENSGPTFHPRPKIYQISSLRRRKRVGYGAAAVPAFERLSALEATWLALDDERQTQHIVLMAVFEQRGADERALRGHAVASLAGWSRARRRLAAVPGVNHPVLSDARLRIRLAPALRQSRRAGRGRASKTVTRIYAEPLDRQRPLWEQWYVTGHEPNRLVVLTKAHPCLFDERGRLPALMALLRAARDARSFGRARASGHSAGSAGAGASRMAALQDQPGQSRTSAGRIRGPKRAGEVGAGGALARQRRGCAVRGRCGGAQSPDAARAKRGTGDRLAGAFSAGRVRGRCAWWPPSARARRRDPRAPERAVAWRRKLPGVGPERAARHDGSWPAP